ncbi:MAG: ABC transporter ATP-binding protein, partial [Lactococcus lactis]|nr:ABC transporter ATP-binding protein [Lactococcus lactis]
AIAPIANRVIQMHDGKIKQIDNNSQPEDIDRIEW